MPDTKNKTQIRAVVVTVSDSRTETDDISGVTLVGLLLEIEAEIVEKIIVSDDLETLTSALKTQSERDGVNLVFTVGGTGLTARDNTPEATRAVIEREAPGIGEAMRQQTLKNTAMAMLARGICGTRGKCLIINFPGSTNAVRECFAVIKPVLAHAVNLLKGETRHDIETHAD